MLAGVAMNFFLAFVIFSSAFFVGTGPIAINGKFITDIQTKLIPTPEQAVSAGMLMTDGLSLSPISGSIAEKAGIRDQDILLAIDGKKVSAPTDMIQRVSESKKNLDFTIRRNSKEIHLSVLPSEGKIGCYVGFNITKKNEDFQYKFSFFESIREGAKETYAQSRMTISLLGDLVKKIITPKNTAERKEAVESLSGPVAMG